MTGQLNLKQIFKMMRKTSEPGWQTLDWDGERCTTHLPEEMHPDLRKTLKGLPAFQISVKFKDNEGFLAHSAR